MTAWSVGLTDCVCRSYSGSNRLCVVQWVQQVVCVGRTVGTAGCVCRSYSGYSRLCV